MLQDVIELALPPQALPDCIAGRVELVISVSNSLARARLPFGLVRAL